MNLSGQHCESYRQDGFVIVPDLLHSHEIAALRIEADRLMEIECEERILEANGKVRAFFSPHTKSDIFQSLFEMPRLLQAATQLIGDELYIHQAKIHPKCAMEGTGWEWHQDFWYWHMEDGMPESKVVTVALFLEEVTAFNGPMLVIPGSHKQLFELARNDCNWGERHSVEIKGKPDWLESVVDAAKYKIDQDSLRAAIKESRIVSVEGAPGTAMFFHGSVLHASGQNMSPWNRLSIFVTYNRVDNALVSIPKPRPEFLANRHFTPLKMNKDEFLIRDPNVGKEKI